MIVRVVWFAIKKPPRYFWRAIYLRVNLVDHSAQELTRNATYTKPKVPKGGFYTHYVSLIKTTYKFRLVAIILHSIASYCTLMHPNAL